MECLQQLLEALEPVVVAAAGDFSQSYEGFSTDTRTVKAGNVFVALSGERFDGHDFVVGAAEAGAVCAIVERKVDAAITQIVVTDSGLAFHDQTPSTARSICTRRSLKASRTTSESLKWCLTPLIS